MGLPTKHEILDFIKGTHASPPGKREIARAFSVKGVDRAALKQLLAEMADEGLLSGNRKGFKEPGVLPPVAVLEIVARDADGELIAEPASWKGGEGERPRSLRELDPRLPELQQEAVRSRTIGCQAVLLGESIEEQPRLGLVFDDGVLRLLTHGEELPVPARRDLGPGLGPPLRGGLDLLAMLLGLRELLALEAFQVGS